MGQARSLTMKYAGGVVKHLGLQMYTGPVPAIAELVANAWDASATEVSIEVPFGSRIDRASTIRFSDDGEGMGWDDLANKYMVVGRNARDKDGELTKRYGRMRMARKGLGKLAGFGIADLIEVSSVKGGRKTRFAMRVVS